MHAQALITRYLSPQPGACQRLGSAIFVETPLFRAKKTCHPVYINPAAYMRIFACDDIPSWDEMAKALTILFSTTIEPEHGTGEVVATAYVDRQSDPLDLSLSGNLGSGRAYYCGAHFNIKGERTPLATAKEKKFSDGFVEMERAMWETLVANGLQGSITTGLNEVLAIIDMNDTCSVGWRDHPVKRAKVIRLDDGCLDRVTHVFHQPRPLPAQELRNVARCYGQLEADKFCARIVHGTWSPGNISLGGHLIDFDTVCATKGRAPTYSSTRWYHQNRFGFEKGGQTTILQALAKDNSINVDAVRGDDLADELERTLSKHLAYGFIALMGFDSAPALYDCYADDVDAVCALWQELARNGYDCPPAYILKDTRANHLHVFDTAAFMAAYPLLLRHKAYNHSEALALMRDEATGEEILAGRLAAAPPTEVEKPYQDAVDAVIGPYMVDNVDTLNMLDMAALSFVRKYDRLFHILQQSSGMDLARIEAQALLRNEDRRALFPALTATFRLAENVDALTPAHLSQIMTGLIESSLRPLDARAREARWGMQVFREGAFWLELDGTGGCRPTFASYVSMPQPTEIEWNNVKYRLDATGHGPRIETSVLMPHMGRIASLQMSAPRIYSQNEHISLTPV